MQDNKPELENFFWQDPFLLEKQLNEDDRMLRDAAAKFADKELRPSIVQEYTEMSKFSQSFLRKWVKLGS